MIKAQTLDMVICRSDGAELHSAWHLTNMTVNCQAECSISPLDLQIIMCKI